MTENNLPVPQEGADLELIVEYLNKHLDPERTEQVRRRLDEDPAFRDLAAPLILTWSIPTHLERHPRPPGELERDWDDFTRRAGFAHQRRKVRRQRLWLLGIAFLMVSVAGFLARKPIAARYNLARHFAAVPHDTGWIPVGDSILARVEPGATLRVSRQLVVDERHFHLDGTARFLVLPRDSVTPPSIASGMVVRTRGGLVTGTEGEFTVTTRGDTTEVEVHRPSRRRFYFFLPVPTGAAVRRDAGSDALELLELGRARLVRGRQPTRLPRAEEP